MMMFKKSVRLLAVVGTVLIFSFGLWAGTTGKIAGRVTDAKTHEALPGANIVIEGTTMGAAADVDGYFVILNVPPGTYTITASVLGYQPMSIKGVKIEADRTTSLNFTLSPTVAAKVKPVIVTARVPTIRKDLTESVNIVSSEEVRSLPIENISEVVTQQAGVISRGGLHIRGGRPDEVVYVVDGVEIRDPYSNFTQASVPLLSVEETAISRGGFDVDQGTVSSGAISVVTKEGGPRYDITAKTYTYDFSRLGDKVFRTVDANYGDQYRDFLTGKNLDLSSPIDRHHDKTKVTEIAIGGPISPFKRKGAKFFISSGYNNGYGRFPVSNDPNYKNWNESYQWKLSFPYSSLKFYTSGFYYRQINKSYSPGWRFALDHLSTFKDRRLQFIAGINHIISPKTYWELRIGFFNREFTNNVFEDVNHNGVDDFDDRDKDGFVEIDLDYFKAFRLDTFMTWGKIDSVKPEWYLLNIDSLFMYVSPQGDTLYPTIYKDKGYVEIPYYWWDMNVESFYPSIGSGPHWWPTKPTYVDPVTGDTLPILDPVTGDTTLLTTYGWGQRTQVDMSVLEVQTPSGIDTVIQVGNYYYNFPFTWPLVSFNDSVLSATDTILKLGNQWMPNEHTWYRVPFYYGKSGYTTAKWKLSSQVTRHHEILAGVEYKKIDISRYVADYVSGGNTYFSVLNPPIGRRPGDYHNFIDWFDENPLKPWMLAAYLRDKVEVEGMVAKVGLRFDYYDPGGFTLSDTSDPFVTDSVWKNLRTFKNPKRAKNRWYISPRIGISHPISERDVLHFTYGHYFQVPPFSQIISSYVFSGAFPVIGNADVKPEKTISYELGVKHAFTNQLVLDVTAFYKDIKDWSRLKTFSYGLGGGNYSTYVNEDWGSVRGLEFSLQKRPGGTFLPYFSGNLTYTFQVASGSFSSPWNAYIWMWRGYPLPPYESPLNWDQRHSVVLTLGFNVPRDRTFLGKKALSDLGLTLQHFYGSGYPYTPPIHSLRDAIEKINSERLPSYQSTNMRIYKGFSIGHARLLTYVDMTNIFNRKDLNSPNDTQWYYQFHDPEGEVKDPSVWRQRRTTRFGMELNFSGF